MNKLLRYFFILLIFLVIVNINMISAEEINQNSNSFLDYALNDNNGIDLENVNINSNRVEKINNDNNNQNTAHIETNNDNNNQNTAHIETNNDNNNQNLKVSNNTYEQNEILGETNSNNPNNDNSNANDLKNDEINSDSTNSQSDSSKSKSYLSCKNYVIKNKYLHVYLKNKYKKSISNEKVKLTINGKTLSAKTNKKGIAKFKIKNSARTYKINLEFEGNSKYAPSSKTLDLRVIGKPVFTKLTVAETGIIKNEYLKVYLKSKKGKAIGNQKIQIKINGKTFLRTTDKNGLAKVKLNLKSRIYKLKIKYDGKSNYMPAKKTTRINVIDCKIIGKTKYGKVYFLKTIGNRKSKIRIAYVVGLHIIEHQIHESVYKIMKNKVDMRYKYYIYRIVLTKKAGDYSIDRMSGQKLAKKFIVPHAKRQKYNLVIDIHSTTGKSYAKSYFIHVPKNKHKKSMKLAKKTIRQMKAIEKNSKIVYWSPDSQTSPPYIHLPLIKAGTPTFVFETLTSEKKARSNKRARILITAVDKIFG